jgi:anhydro-N-acetylmuramic acid kinase
LRTPNRLVGIMSGTSLDGADAVVVEFDSAQSAGLLRAHAYAPYGVALKQRLLNLHHPGFDDLHEAQRVAQQLAHVYAEAARAAIAKANVPIAEIRALACHGQTIRHRPDSGYSVQLNNPALLAEILGCAVIADFRSRDIAAGGQGAPLVPAFHQAAFAADRRPRAVVNIGGIANVSLIGRRVLGWDTGPGNMLLDAWAQRHLGTPFDRAGAWAGTGRPIDELLEAMLGDAFFRRPAPKSCGRDQFNLLWLARFPIGRYAAADIQASLVELTARSIAGAIPTGGDDAVVELLLCGGGAHNDALRRRLIELLPQIPVRSTAEYGVPVEHVEAMAFAWLGWQTVNGLAGNCPAVTGAAGQRILGAIYPA